MRRAAVVMVLVAIAAAGGACKRDADAPRLPPVQAAANPTEAHALIDEVWAHIDSYRSGVDTEVGLAVWIDAWTARVREADAHGYLTPDLRDHMLMLAEVTKDMVAPVPDARARADAEAAVRKWSHSIYSAPWVHAVTLVEVGPAIEAEIVNLHMMADGVPLTSDKRKDYEHRAAFPVPPTN